VAADGGIYIAGNAGKPVSSLPGGAKPVTLGEPAKEPKCGCGFVARLSADANRILAYVQFAPGVALLTTVEVNNQGVYAGGYASAALESIVEDLPGLMRQYPLAREAELTRAGKIAEAIAPRVDMSCAAFRRPRRPAGATSSMPGGPPRSRLPGSSTNQPACGRREFGRPRNTANKWEIHVPQDSQGLLALLHRPG